jgi:hypothetical protein
MTSDLYLGIAIGGIVIVSVLVFLVGGKGQRSRLTPLAGLAFAFIISGVLFGEERFIGYGLMGVGVVLAVVDIIVRSKRQK